MLGRVERDDAEDSYTLIVVENQVNGATQSDQNVARGEMETEPRVMLVLYKEEIGENREGGC